MKPIMQATTNFTNTILVVFGCFFFMISSCARQQIVALVKPAEANEKIYVENGKNGDGSASNPYSSIQKALEKALYNKNVLQKSTEVIIRSGVYREVISITDSAKNELPIIIRADKNANVVISGAVTVNNWRSGKEASWTQNTSKTNVYVASLTDEIIQKLTKNPFTGKHYPDGKVPNPWGGYVTDNGMFCNGLLKIDSDYYFPIADADKLVPGSFSIDYARKLIFAKLKAKIKDFNSIELGVEPTLFRMANQKNVTIQNIHFEHAGWALHDAVIFNKVENLFLLNCTFNNNRYAGLQTDKLNKGLIRNCEASYNGGIGASGSWEGYIRNVTFDGFKANFNNWIGAQFDFTGWAPCGVKWSGVRNLVIKNSEFNANYATGLWLDCDNRNVTVLNTEAKDNIGVGFFVEASKGPFLFKNCRSVNNLRGFYVSCSEGVQLEDCLIKNNDNQFVIFDHWGKGRGPGLFEYDFKEYGTGALWEAHTINTVVKNTVFVNREGSDQPFYTEIFSDTTGFKNFVSSLTSKNNSYYTNSPEKAFYYNNRHYTLEMWQLQFGKDQGSTVQPISRFSGKNEQ